MPDEQQALSTGRQILHYRLSEKIGEGGMGVVWRATDTTLDRQVAIKVLPSAFATDPERMGRFEREARLLASLNHPNIATVFSVHTVEGVRYLTMELVPGEDLAQRIAAGPTPVAEAIDIARQIALALEAAHDSGVVHRDLKPANVRITPEGRVKVLDFGLAKALETSASSPVLSQSPTFPGSAMGSGTIIGTAAYMSPEQARGKPVDRRADIWAFGVVFYELLTGRRAFEGETISDTLAAVLRAEPDLSLLPADLPRSVRVMLERCLEKNPHRRLRDIGEALLVLEDVQTGRVTETPTPAPSPVPRTEARHRWIWAGSLVLVAVLAAMGGWLWRPVVPPSAHRKFTLMLEHPRGELTNPAISPDGRRLAFVVDRKLWVRDLDQISSRVLADGLDSDFRPAWSPDGASIAIGNNAGLAKVSVASGSVTPLCPIGDFSGGSGADWLPDGRVVFAKGIDHLYVVSASGGTPSMFVQKDTLDADLHHPHVLPGGRGVIYVRHLVMGGAKTLSLAVGSRRTDLLTLPSGFAWEPVYDPNGFILFSRVGEGAGVWALPFSLQRLKATGEPFLIAANASSVTVATNGDLTYRLATQSVESSAVLVNRSGAIVDTLTGALSAVWSMALSPDDRMLVTERREGGEGDIWLHDLERNSQTRFAFGPGRQMEPAWSPDGRSIVYRDMNTSALWVKPADGALDARRLSGGLGGRFTSDGRYLIHPKVGMDNGLDIWQTSVAGDDSTALIATPANEDFPAPAPQGKFLAYSSDETGRTEIYLRQYPIAQGRWQVSTNGGVMPLWSARGDALYYREGDRILEVKVTLEPSVRLATPQQLFRMSDLRMQDWGRHYFLPTSRPDRFVALKPTEEAAPPQADVLLVQNWRSEFAKK
ncbi:MAG TPA: protein kinase [Candidatus Eisenbacteria bacterium]|nr:protein kinase [Candidatus Eisenbacteria bacterium]